MSECEEIFCCIEGVCEVCTCCDRGYCSYETPLEEAAE